MAGTGTKCWGHAERVATKNKISKLSKSTVQSPDEDFKVLIKKGPVSVETSLKELEESYASKPNWKKIEEGGVLSVPLEEFRMIDPPKPNQAGHVNFGKSGRGTKIEKYTVAETIENLNALILDEYNKEKVKAKAAGENETDSAKEARAKALRLPQFNAVKKWQDVEAEIKLKRALEDMMENLKIPALIIRSVSLKAIFELKNLGLKIPDGDGELDLIMAYASGDFLHVVIFEVKRADTCPWQTRRVPLNKQAVDKAEKQLKKDLDILMAILTGIPPSHIIFHTLACFPDSLPSELQAVFCAECCEANVVTKADCADLFLLQKKTQVPSNPVPATSGSKQYLLKLTARCLSHQSLLHIGYRDVEDKEKLVTERHKYNLESVDGKIKEKEFVVASPQQQQVIASFSASPTQRHLVLEGPSGTGKTLVSLQVTMNLLESIDATTEKSMGPVLVVTTGHREESDPIMKYLNDCSSSAVTKIFKSWMNMKNEFGLSESHDDTELIYLTKALAEKWKGQQIVMLVDEIIHKDMLRNLNDSNIPPTVRMILIVNPDAIGQPLTMPSSFFRVTLRTIYRSTKAITRLTRFIAECKGLSSFEGDFGSDVEGSKPTLFDVGKNKNMMEKVLAESRKLLGDNVTILYGDFLPQAIFRMVMKQGKKAGGPWDCYWTGNYSGWEAEKVVAVIGSGSVMEQITRAVGGFLF